MNTSISSGTPDRCPCCGTTKKIRGFCRRVYARWHYWESKQLRRPRKKTKLMGLIHLGESTPGWPAPIEGVDQRVIFTVPTQCPKCQGGGMTVEGREVHCQLCGGTWVLVQVA